MSRVRTVHAQCFYASPRLLCPFGGFQSQTPRDRKWKVSVHRLDDPSIFIEICVQVITLSLCLQLQYRPGEICKSHRSQREDERSHVLYLAVQRECYVHMRNLTYWQ